MKKKLFYYLFAALCMSAVFTACSDDDDVIVNPISEPTTFTSENGLKLTYNGAPLLGKKVTFTADPTDGRKVTLRLEGETLDFSSLLGGNRSNIQVPTAPGVFPGTPVVELAVEAEVNGNTCSFNGTSETNFCTYTYAGKASQGELSLELTDVKLKNAALANTTWKPTPYYYDEELWEVTEQPFHIVWESEKQVEIIPGWGMPVETIVAMALRMPTIPSDKVDEDRNPVSVSVETMLCTVLKDVTLKEDGNISATYMDAANGGTAYASPANIAQYVIAGDNKLLLFLNPQAIMANVKTMQRAAGITDPSFIQQAMATLLPLLGQGVPVIYELNGNDMKVYLNTELLLPLMKNLVAPLFQSEDFVAMIMEAMTKDPTFGEMAGMMTPVLKSVPEIIEKTSKIEIGLNLRK